VPYIGEEKGHHQVPPKREGRGKRRVEGREGIDRRKEGRKEGGNWWTELMEGRKVERKEGVWKEG
jgi:hypothetical protein